ncbi:MAG: TonB C-terminal domain-containing protein [Acidobacteriota bacterium]|nr:TonB C-terminal domain-containing protein [Acidobacteriota bacterium]
MITIVRLPKRKKGLLIAAAVSVVTHVVLYLVVYYAPIFGLAMKLRDVQFVEEDYNRGILITFTKKMKYPNGYMGFRAPEKTQSLEDQKKEQAKLAKREADRRRKEEELRKQEELAQHEAEQKAAEEKAKAEELAKAQQTDPTTPEQPDKPETYGAFGRINTAPIKDQVKRLYDANKEGKLSLPAGKMKIGVTGTVKPDGTLADYKITESSGIKEIDDAALAILAAVSESKAMGPLHQLTSLSLVLAIDQEAQLIVTGFTANEEDARNITNLAQAALLVARLKKTDDPGAMLMLNNLKVRREGQRIQAIISMPREKAQESLTKTMAKGQG